MPDCAQPDAGRIPDDLLDAVLASIAAPNAATASQVIHRNEFSNDFAELRLENRRAIIVKRGRYDWDFPGFRTSRIASRLIGESTGIEVPAPLPDPHEFGGRPVEAYWRIDRPTLQEIWPGLDARERRAALRSWGELLARLHSVERRGYGALSDPATSELTLGDYLARELEERLLHAVVTTWPQATAAVEALIDQAEEASGRVTMSSRLIHSDLHMGNVLSDAESGTVECVGIIDLETAWAGPREADLAAIEVHHGGLFGAPLSGAWVRELRHGYGASVDDWLVAYFRAFHLVNMGLHSALIGHDWHAARVAEASLGEIDELRRLDIASDTRSRYFDPPAAERPRLGPDD